MYQYLSTTSDLFDVRKPDDVDLMFDDEHVKVFHGGVEIACIPLGAYQLVRPDHDACIIGKRTVWHRESVKPVRETAKAHDVVCDTCCRTFLWAPSRRAPSMPHKCPTCRTK